MNLLNVEKLKVWLLWPKQLVITTRKAYFKRDCLQMKFLMLVD